MSEKPLIAAKLKAMRNRTGLSVRAFAEAIGRVASSYQHYESTYKKRSLPPELVDDMEPVLRAHGVTDAEILELRGAQPKTTDNDSPPQIRPNHDRTMALAHQSKDLPVLGAARGGTMEAGAFADNGNFFEMVARPASLVGVSDAYAVYVVDESMEPRYFSGEIVHIHPHRPARPGSFVVLQIDDGEKTDYLVKRLVRRKSTQVTFEQYNPPKRFEIKASHIKAMHTIVGAATPA